MPPAMPAQLNAYDSSWAHTAPPPHAIMSAGSSHLPTFTVHDDLMPLEREWLEFERIADCTAFQSFEWLSTWQQHIGARAGVRPAVVVGRIEGNILFILPLAIRNVAFARELTFLGSELCDYNAPLLAPDFSNRIRDAEFRCLWTSIEAHLRGGKDGCDLVRFLKMPAKVGTQANPMLALSVTLNPSGTYATPLDKDWEKFYVTKRSSTTRRRDRTKRKRLTETGEVKFVTPGDSNEVVHTLDTLMEQKRRSFSRMGVPNLFARPGHADFYRSIATDSRTRHLVHVSRLDVGPEIAAANFGLIFHGTYYHVQASYTDSDLARFGPGTAHLHELLRYAIAQGCETFDFTIGDERYKLDWCDRAEPLYDYISSINWRGALIVAPLIALQSLKRWIKKTPWLWDAVSTTRARLGSLLSRRGETEDAR